MIVSKLLTKTQAAKVLNKYKAFSSPIKVTELAYCAAVNGDLQPALDQHHKWCLNPDKQGAHYSALRVRVAVRSCVLICLLV